MIVKKGEVYYADLNPIIGCEQGGCRPVIIVQNNNDRQSLQPDNNNSSCYCPQEKESATDSYKG